MFLQNIVNIPFFLLLFQSCSGVKVIWWSNRPNRGVVRHAVQAGGHFWGKHHGTRALHYFFSVGRGISAACLKGCTFVNVPLFFLFLEMGKRRPERQVQVANEKRVHPNQLWDLPSWERLSSSSNFNQGKVFCFLQATFATCPRR